MEVRKLTGPNNEGRHTAGQALVRVEPQYIQLFRLIAFYLALYTPGSGPFLACPQLFHQVWARPERR